MSDEHTQLEDEPIEHDAPVVEAAADDGKTRKFPCHQCGAELEWKPGVGALTCPYCGHHEEPPSTAEDIKEYAFNDLLQDKRKDRGLGTETRSVRCPGCGAQSDLAPDVVAADCPFCGTMVEDDEAHDDRIRPEALVPFRLEREAARKKFQNWLGKRWFAPGALKNAVADRFNGVYRCWWTFDSNTVSHWSGQAGYYYYVTRTRTVNGKTQTYQQRKVRWRSRSGTYREFFDDVLTQGFTTGLQASGYQLRDLVPFTAEALAGFQTERYAVDPKAGWAAARTDIENVLRERCSERLGGDTQRFLSVDTAHSGITFKSVLLPVWHSTYRHGDKVYRIAVNGQNGHVEAERPWSVIKITLAVLAAVAVIGLIVWLVNRAS